MIVITLFAAVVSSCCSFDVGVFRLRRQLQLVCMSLPAPFGAIGLRFVNIAALVLLRMAWYVRFSLLALAVGLIILLNVY